MAGVLLELLVVPDQALVTRVPSVAGILAELGLRGRVPAAILAHRSGPVG